MIEERFKAGIDRWVKNGIPPGGFLTAVLENNLSVAIGKADEDAFKNLRDIVSYCYNNIPAAAWGSKERFAKWSGMDNITQKPE